MKRAVIDVRGWRAVGRADYGYSIYVMRKRKEGHTSRQARQGSSAADMQIDERQRDLQESQRWGVM